MKKLIGILSVLLVLIVCNVFVLFNKHKVVPEQIIYAKEVEKLAVTTTSIETTETTTSETTTQKQEQVEKIDWQRSSEDEPYPTLKNSDVLLVSTQKQRVFIQRDDQTIYTMYCSTGAEETPTPKGEFVIEPEKGETFFNADSGEGANYYVSFKDHGVYLFHSVPIDKSGKYIIEEAEELGHKANSHGCVRLSVPDAQWFYENSLVGMKVKIV